jgi:hypothetical protein
MPTLGQTAWGYHDGQHDNILPILPKCSGNQFREKVFSVWSEYNRVIKAQQRWR